MENQFSFIHPPELSALEHAIELLPGLDQVDLVCFDSTKSDLCIYRNTRVQHQLETLTIPHSKRALINKFRDQIKLQSWYDQKELPLFEIEQQDTNTSLFDELLKSTLCIGFPSKHDHHHDIYIFYFRKDTSEFGPISSDSVLNTQQKNILGRLVYNSMKAILNQFYKNRSAMAEYNKMLSSLIQTQHLKIQEKDKEIARHQDYLDKILWEFIDEIKSPEDHIEIDNDVRILLRPYLNQSVKIKRSLSNALNFIKTMQFGQAASSLVLSIEYFSEWVDKSGVKDAIIESNHSYSASTKTYLFLDELEKAANNLLTEGRKLTSSNVGGILENPITAAAISDKLKNHGHKINLLLEENPEKWQTIRDRFKPIINIQERIRERKRAS